MTTSFRSNAPRQSFSALAQARLSTDALAPSDFTSTSRDHCIMNAIAKTLAASLVVLAAGTTAAHAESLASYPDNVRAAGTNAGAGNAAPIGANAVAIGDAAAYPDIVRTGSGLTRAEVQADVERARRDGSLWTDEAGPVRFSQRSASRSM